MIRTEVIQKRLNKLDEYLSILYGLQKYSFEEFIKNPEHYGSAERFLQLGIEVITDLGNHVIAEQELGIVNWHSDIPTLLETSGYINTNIKEKWIRMIGFRNILIHEYLDIDRKIVYDVLQHHIKDMEEIKQVFAQFL